MISDKLEQATLNPEKDYHLKMEIRRILRLIESDIDYSDIVDNELDSVYPIFHLDYMSAEVRFLNIKRSAE